jgi:hypothetical protein
MTGDKAQLTYRELADRLGTTPDAARMKAKRAVSKGLWRIVLGNHPNDPVRVELPASDLNKPERVVGGRNKRAPGERSGGTPARTNPDALADIVAALQSAQDRVHQLTDALTAEKDQHRQTAIELAQAETREMGMAAEVERLHATIAELQDHLRLARRSWWRRLFD